MAVEHEFAVNAHLEDAAVAGDEADGLQVLAKGLKQISMDLLRVVEDTAGDTVLDLDLGHEYETSSGVKALILAYVFSSSGRSRSSASVVTASGPFRSHR